MKLPRLVKGTLIKRYKRFMADVKLEDGSIVTAHCPNSGSMKGCADPGSRACLSISVNTKRKLPYTWELVESDGGWIGINTGLSNYLAREAIENGVVKELQGFPVIRPEVPYGSNSRIDLLLESEAGLCYVEVKNVTLADGRRALFPDAVTTRGQKHLHELTQVVRAGHRGVIFFAVQRGDVDSVSPADHIDPEYGRLLRLACENGVEPLAYQGEIGTEEIRLVRRLPVIL